MNTKSDYTETRQKVWSLLHNRPHGVSLRDIVFSVEKNTTFIEFILYTDIKQGMMHQKVNGKFALGRPPNGEEKLMSILFMGSITVVAASREMGMSRCGMLIMVEKLPLVRIATDEHGEERLYGVAQRMHVLGALLTKPLSIEELCIHLSSDSKHIRHCLQALALDRLAVYNPKQQVWEATSPQLPFRAHPGISYIGSPPCSPIPTVY